MKKIIRLNEQELYRLVNESVKMVLNESTDEGVVKNLAMAGLMGLGVAGGMNNAQAQQQINNQPKASSSVQHQLYNKIHSNDTLSYNDYLQKIGNATEIMKNNRNQDYIKIKNYMEELSNPELLHEAFPGQCGNDGLNYAMQNGGPENFMIIYGVVLPKTMTIEQFKEKVNSVQNNNEIFNLSDFN